MQDEIRRLFDESLAVTRDARDRLAENVARAAELIAEAHRAGRGVFTFGNGGSGSDAQHIAAELVGRFLVERRPLKAQSLCANPALLTCLANDYGTEETFARQLAANATSGDVAVGISTSGRSANVVRALAKAREIGCRTIALTGEGGGECAEFADVLLDVPSRHTPRVQEAHAVLYHILCELVEKAAAGE
jgi:D-sedoheptulose 7-phosphate isomerase